MKSQLKNEKQADIIEKKKNINANRIQVIFNQFHENLNTEKQRNETAVITINKSFKDLLIIIINGIIDQINIRNLSNIDFLFSDRKKFCVMILHQRYSN